MKNNHITGVAILVFTTAMYGLYGIYSRLIALEFSVFSQNWVRNLFVLVLTLILTVIFRRKWKKIAKKDVPWITAWVVCDIIFVIAIFIAFNSLSIGTALFLLYCGSTIAGYIAGSVLLKEKLTKIKIIAILFSLIGLFLIFTEQIQLINSLFLVLGLFTGLVAGFWNVLPKLISNEYPKLQLIAIDALSIMIVTFILASIYNQTVPPISTSLAWIGLILYGLTQFIADILIIQGFRMVEAHVGSLILPFEAVFGVLFAYLIFKETIPVTTLFGGLLIILAAFLPNIKKLRS